MWSKGAVVIVKRGDEALADAIEKGLDITTIESNGDAAEEVANLKRANYFLSKKSRKVTDEMIAEARELYGYNWTPPKWANKIIEGFAFITAMLQNMVLLVSWINWAKKGKYRLGS